MILSTLKKKKNFKEVFYLMYNDKHVIKFIIG